MALFGLYCTDAYPFAGSTAPAGAKVVIISVDPAGDYTPPPGLTMRADDGTPTWQPATPVPDQVSNSQFRLLMLRTFLPSGTSYFNAVENSLAANKAATASMADDAPQKVAAWSAYTKWNNGAAFHRSDPLVIALAVQFGLTDAQVDALFIRAGST